MTWTLTILLIGIIFAYEVDRRASERHFDDEFDAIVKERDYFRDELADLQKGQLARDSEYERRISALLAKLAKFDRKHARDGRFAGK